TPSDTGYDGKSTVTAIRPGGPFNRPTNVAIGPRGDIYVSDGYGNCRVHRFSPTGELKRSWGVAGQGPGEYFAEWTDTRRPTHLVFDGQGRAYVSELWWQPGQTSLRYGPAAEVRAGRVSVYDRDGRVLAR